MKQDIFNLKSMVIGMLLLTSTAGMANSSTITSPLFKSDGVIVFSTGIATTGQVMIEILTKRETYELGKQLFGGEKGLAAIGSGFVQKAPGATRDPNPGLETQIPPISTSEQHLLGDDIRSELIKLITKPDFRRTNIEKTESLVHFTINQRNEVVVLVVDTDDLVVNQFLKSRLNYKKLSSAVVGKKYSVKVTINNG